MIEVSEDDVKTAMLKYGYTIEFTDKHTHELKVMRDLGFGGYLWLARRKKLAGIESSLQHYSHDTGSIRCVVEATVIFEIGRDASLTPIFEKYTALSDMDDRSKSVRGKDMVVRSCETTALKRAFKHALGIDSEQLQDYPVGESGAPRKSKSGVNEPSQKVINDEMEWE